MLEEILSGGNGRLTQVQMKYKWSLFEGHITCKMPVNYPHRLLQVTSYHSTDNGTQLYTNSSQSDHCHFQVLPRHNNIHCTSQASKTQKKRPSSIEIVKMSSLAPVANAHANLTSNRYNEELSGAKPFLNNYPILKTSNQAMEMNSTNTLGYHCNKFIRKKIKKIPKKERSCLTQDIPFSACPHF